MLTIRSEQMHVFEEDFFVRQAEFLYFSLGPQFPDVYRWFKPREGVEMVARVLAMAFRDGFREEQHATAYTCLALRWGEAFRDQPWARDVIADKHLPADLRISELLRRSEALITEAEMESDPDDDEEVVFE